MKIETTQVFDKTIDAFLDDDIRVIISYGGTSSSKSISIYQLLFLYAMKNPKKNIAIVAESVPVLKRNVVKDLKNVVMKEFWNPQNFNKQDLTYTFPNGSIFQFLSGSNPDSFRGYRSDIAYFDEVSNIPKETYDQITMRCKHKILCSFNPTSEFYIVDEMGREDANVIKSTYADNRFLDEGIIKELIIKGSKSKRFKDVYIDGNFGVLDGIIFEEDLNWTIVQNNKLPKDYKWRLFGIDWGFTNDPTTLVEVRYYNKELYIHQHIYKTHLLASDVYDYIKDNNLLNETFKSDNSEPREIEFLRKKGLNIKGVKYPVMSSINRLQEYKLNITQSSVETIKELRNYAFKKDKINNRYLNYPIDMWNHCFSKDTKIITDNGVKNIIDITSKDKIKTRKGYKSVLSSGKTGTKLIYKYEIELSNGDNIILQCTNNHLIKTNEKWVQIKELKKGMKIYQHKNLMEKSINYIKENDTQLNTLIKDFVATNVNLNTEEIQERITSKDFANFVEQNLQPISTQKDNSVQEVAVLNIKISEVGYEDVYDITVAEMPEYFANGVLVHNCIDAIRYSVSEKLMMNTSNGMRIVRI